MKKRIIFAIFFIIIISGCVEDIDGVEIDEVRMPFDKDAYGNWTMGMWPFCVHGGEHPEGHGGIDFELEKNTPILAPCTGEVEMIDSYMGVEEGIFIACKGILVNIFGIKNMKFKEGDEVTKGEIIGTAKDMGEVSGFIHFEIITDPGGDRVCPLDYMDKEFKSFTEEMFKFAYYDEMESEPLLCNCEVAPPPR